jgi:hypothetical protein
VTAEEPVGVPRRHAFQNLPSRCSLSKGILKRKADRKTLKVIVSDQLREIAVEEGARTTVT